MATTRNGGPVVVTGPGVEGKDFPNIGSALAYAMHKCSRCTTDDCAWYVRNIQTGEKLAVEKQPDGSVTYIRVKGGN